MQTVMQYKQNPILEQTSLTENEDVKAQFLNSRIPCEDLLGLSWIFLDEEYTSQFKEDY